MQSDINQFLKTKSAAYTMVAFLLGEENERIQKKIFSIAYNVPADFYAFIYAFP